MQPSRKSILITGGCGFVGRHISKRFSTMNYNVVCVDNLASESAMHPSKWPDHLKCEEQLQFLEMDCQEFFKSSLLKMDFDIVFHLAAIVGGRNVIENSPISVANDLSIDSQMFNWAISAKPRKIVFFSSSAAYPIKYQMADDNKRTLSEDLIDFDSMNIGMPDMTYGWSKLTGEYLAKNYHKSTGASVVCYRPFSGYGEDQNDVYPFPGILKRVVNKETPINIWSDTVRDFVYIEDAIDCVIQTMELVDDGSAINIGSGVGTRFTQLAKQMCDLLNHSTDINVLTDKPTGVFYRVGDTTFSEKLGYSAKTSLLEGIQICAKFMMTTV